MSNPGGQSQNIVGSESEFKQALLERASEVKRIAEELRLDGLRRIADMNKFTSGMHPLDFIPKEIWAIILDKLRPEDRANMYQVHDVFSDLLEGNLIRDTLFPLVLMDYKIPLAQTLGNQYYFFSRKQLATLRLVSKSLRDAVDRWIENRFSKAIRNFRPLKIGDKKLLNTVDFYLSQHKEVLDALLIERPLRFFLRSIGVYFHAKVRHYPFAGLIDPSWVIVQPGSDLERRLLEHKQRIPQHVPILMNNVTEFLATVGDQLWHLRLGFHIDGLAKSGVVLSFAEVYNMIRDWLMLVPNLKWLVIEMQCEESFMDTKNQNERLPMPRLGSLERFNLWNDDVNPIGNAILSSNPHIKNHPGILECIEGPSEFTLALPLETVAFLPLSSSDLELKVPQQIINNNWHLRRVSLSIAPEKEEDADMPEPSSMNQIFGFLQRFQTLEVLDLHVGEIKAEEKINYLNLPNLKDLWLQLRVPTAESFGRGAEFLFSLQFLWHCKKLRSLIWENFAISHSCSIRQEMEQVGPSQSIWIDFMGGTGDLTVSNVWDVFPELRNIKVSFDYKEEEDYDKDCRFEYQRRKLCLPHEMDWSPKKFFWDSY